jgi:hypothetical protein
MSPKKNTLSNTITKLKTSASLHAHQFAEGRAAHPVLAPYQSADDALAALRYGSQVSLDDKGLILAAMVKEHQRTGRPLWEALLAGAFEGALLRLRVRLGRRVDADLDQRVILGFLEAISSPFVAAAGRHAHIAIVRASKKVVFGLTIAERAEPRPQAFDEASYVSDGPSLAGDEPIEDAIGTEVQGAFAKLGDPEEVSDMLFATYVVGETLADYVARIHPTLDAEARGALYERLRRQRLTVVQQLRCSPRFRKLAQRRDPKSRAA